MVLTNNDNGNLDQTVTKEGTRETGVVFFWRNQTVPKAWPLVTEMSGGTRKTWAWTGPVDRIGGVLLLDQHAPRSCRMPNGSLTTPYGEVGI
jgi:hypothetical protein